MFYFFAFIAFVATIIFVLISEYKPNDKNLKKVEQGHMSKVTYEGHTYVVWSINMGGGIVHDPDCECKKGE